MYASTSVLLRSFRPQSRATILASSNPTRFLHRNTFINFVPQQEAWVVERMGRFHKILEPGFNVLIPVVDRIKYVQSLKEIAIEIPQQGAITIDNVQLQLDGVLYLRVVDPFKASYGVDDPEFAVTQLAQTTMRSEVGKISLDTVFKEREQLNVSIVEALNKAADPWGIKCMRYEIRTMTMPERIQQAMQSQVEAERRKRATILESEGKRDAAINVAEGKAKAIILEAKARREGLAAVAESLKSSGGNSAAALIVAEQYVKAFGELAKSTNTLIVPANAADANSMVSQALTVYRALQTPSQQPPADSSAPTDDSPSLW
ncbi:Stomatin-like protein 2, mitochondrial [Aphelenchoides fujianensis]|nr:Stomatin-like protein 2, mitochondrial [Aphelenchoides fujianensis]